MRADDRIEILTPDDDRLLASHARAIIAEYDLAQAEFHALKNATDQDLAIGASLSLAQSLLPKAIARFRRRWPMVSLSVEVGLSAPLFERLLGGDLDLVLSAPEEGLAVDPRISRTFLLEEQDALVVGANDIDHAGNRVGAILGGCTVAQHFNPLQGIRGNVRKIRRLRPARVQHRRPVHPLAIDQDQEAGSLDLRPNPILGLLAGQNPDTPKRKGAPEPSGF